MHQANRFAVGLMLITMKELNSYDYSCKNEIMTDACFFLTTGLLKMFTNTLDNTSLTLNTDGIGMMCGLLCQYMMISAARSVGTISFLPGCWCAMMRMGKSIFMTCWQ